MGLLDDMLGGGGLGDLASLAGQNPDLLKAAGSLLSQSEGSVGGSGGLAEILGALQSQGLGDEVASWLGGGSNLGISADQVTSALSGDTLARFAEMAGIDVSQAASALAGLLPMLIDKLSPGGEAPSGSGLESMLGSLLG